MKRLSEITKSIIYIDGQSIAFTVNNVCYHRKVKSQCFSNWPLNSVVFNKERYLIDESCLEVENLYTCLNVEKTYLPDPPSEVIVNL